MKACKKESKNIHKRVSYARNLTNYLLNLQEDQQFMKRIGFWLEIFLVRQLMLKLNWIVWSWTRNVWCRWWRQPTLNSNSKALRTRKSKRSTRSSEISSKSRPQQPLHWMPTSVGASHWDDVLTQGRALSTRESLLRWTVVLIARREARWEGLSKIREAGRRTK